MGAMSKGEVVDAIKGGIVYHVAFGAAWDRCLHGVDREAMFERHARIVGELTGALGCLIGYDEAHAYRDGVLEQERRMAAVL